MIEIMLKQMAFKAQVKHEKYLTIDLWWIH